MLFTTYHWEVDLDQFSCQILVAAILLGGLLNGQREDSLKASGAESVRT